MPERIMIRNIRPPRTPPTILGTDEGEGEGEGEEVGVVVVLDGLAFGIKGEVEVSLKMEERSLLVKPPCGELKVAPPVPLDEILSVTDRHGDICIFLNSLPPNNFRH